MIDSQKAGSDARKLFKRHDGKPGRVFVPPDGWDVMTDAERGDHAAAELRRRQPNLSTSGGEVAAPPDDDWIEAPIAEPANDGPPNPLLDASKAKTAFPLVLAPELALPLEPIEWLCESLGMALGRPILISGYGGIGKTFAAQELALVVANGGGTIWGGYRADMAGSVVHVDYEQTLWITRWRYQRLAAGRGIDLAGLGNRLGVVSLPPIYLTDPKVEGELVKLCAGRKLCILDNLRASCPGVDENASTVAQYLYLLARVSQATGCIVVIITHEAKDNAQAPRSGIQRLRGSSAIAAAAGAVVSFVKDGEFIKIENTRNNLGAEAEPGLFKLVDEGPIDPATKKSTALRLEWVPPEQAGEERETPAVKVAKVSIVEAVTNHGGQSRRGFRELVRGKHETIDTALRCLVREKRLVIEAGNRGATVYRLPPPD